MIEGAEQVRDLRPTEDRNREVVLLTRRKDGPPVEPKLWPGKRELHDESEPEERHPVEEEPKDSCCDIEGTATHLSRERADHHPDQNRDDRRGPDQEERTSKGR